MTTPLEPLVIWMSPRGFGQSARPGSSGRHPQKFPKFYRSPLFPFLGDMGWRGPQRPSAAAVS